MKKLAILVVASALALAACGKKKDPAAPATTTEPAANPATDATGGGAYGADAYGAPAGDATAPTPE